jgi:hypothetical protein
MMHTYNEYVSMQVSIFKKRVAVHNEYRPPLHTYIHMRV